jgi:transcriptional regulator with XRE-family HTH domain
MTPSTLSAWMTRLGYNKVEAAEALGIARTTLDRYLSGRTAIPRYIALACAAILEGADFRVYYWERGSEQL